MSATQQLPAAAPTVFQLNIDRPGKSALSVTLETGRSMVIIGANGAGKTRLGVRIEELLNKKPVHRIAAQKSLALNDSINLISLERADSHLRTGYPEVGQGNKAGHRWGNKPATHFLSDFDALLQRLFAGHNQVATKHLRDRKTDPNIPVPTTDLDKLKSIWDSLLPHRALEISDATIRVSSQPAANKDAYSGSEMSDGERAIFYFLGQCLVAPKNGVVIIDEPEAHIHKAIVGPLWDAIEKSRPDCAFIYITHDLDFAVERTASLKYFVHSCNIAAAEWEIEEIPEDTGLPEHVVAELLGSRKPVLFVEGDRGSVDLTVYRHQYRDFTTMPIGSCEAVIHSVSSYKHSAALHWVGCKGLVDQDHRDSQECAYLQSLDVHVLPVAEIENIFLLPGVFHALSEALFCDPVSTVPRMIALVVADASANIDQLSARYTTRQLDRLLKRVTVAAKDLTTLATMYSTEIQAIDPAKIFADFKLALSQKIQAKDAAAILALYDNKGLLAQAAPILGLKDKKQFLEKVERLLADERGAKLRDELTKVLPVITV
jgi:ABC-type uncharacterized transport system ATPase subunit